MKFFQKIITSKIKIEDFLSDQDLINQIWLINKLEDWLFALVEYSVVSKAKTLMGFEVGLCCYLRKSSPL